MMPPVQADDGRVAGLLLAAGAGRRYGMPKALVGDGAWLRGSVGVLVEAGCAPVVVVLGAAAERAAPLVPAGAGVVVAEDWSEGMGASLRAGLGALGAANGTFPASDAVNGTFTATSEVTAALVHLVDLPDVGADVVLRVAALAARGVVARASYRGRAGHPVLLGRDHWPEIAGGALGDRGARDWLAGRADLTLVDCTDLASGIDVDRP